MELTYLHAWLLLLYKILFSSERGPAETFSDFRDFTCTEPETFMSLQDNHPSLLLKQLLLSDISSFEQDPTNFIGAT